MDYRRALELDPDNAEARRLCRQFDSKGEVVSYCFSENDERDVARWMVVG